MAVKIVAIFNQKGGSGKTTLAVNLASIAAETMRVLLVDIDNQATATTWVNQASEDNPFPAAISNLAALPNNLRSELAKQMNNYDLIIIDCPPTINNAGTFNALKNSHFVIVPVIPSSADIWAAAATLETIDAAKKANPYLQTFIMASMVSRGNLVKELLEEMREFANQRTNTVLLDNYTSSRLAYRESQIYGHGLSKLLEINEASNPPEAAVMEILDVCEEIISKVYSMQPVTDDEPSLVEELNKQSK